MPLRRGLPRAVPVLLGLVLVGVLVLVLGPRTGTGPGVAAPGVAAPVPVTTAAAPSSPASPAVPVPAPSTAPAEGMSLVVPALGLRTDVSEVSPVGGRIDPPTFDRAYRIAPYGTPGSDNTTYIAGHSWNAGDAVFNPLLDVESQEATLAAGDLVEVVEDGVTYRYEVLSTARYPKGTLADVGEVWDRVPGRLVLITCFQLDTGARSRDNLVVTAQLLPGSPGPVVPSGTATAGSAAPAR
ncbi:class F sortase [Aquipuribacter hungaricus]|uniref:Class F sortase n=1 Tax=Aquipuribacter hungaricus TaxID=545624 RepID=A0ABV7WEA8_9MICO